MYMPGLFNIVHAVVDYIEKKLTQQPTPIYRFVTFLKDVNTAATVATYAPWQVEIEGNVVTAISAPDAIQGTDYIWADRMKQSQGTARPLLFREQITVFLAPKTRLILHVIAPGDTASAALAHMFILHSLTALRNNLFPMCYTLTRFNWKEFITLAKSDKANDVVYSHLYRLCKSVEPRLLQLNDALCLGAIVQEPHFQGIAELFRHLKRIESTTHFSYDGETAAMAKANGPLRSIDHVAARTWIVNIMCGLLCAQRAYGYQLRNISHETLGFYYTADTKACESNYALVREKDPAVTLRVPKDKYDEPPTTRNLVVMKTVDYADRNILVIYPAGRVASELSAMSSGRNYLPVFYELQHATCHALSLLGPEGTTLEAPNLRVNPDVPGEPSHWTRGFYPAPELLFWPRDQWFIRRTVESDNFSLGLTLWYLLAVSSGIPPEDIQAMFAADYNQTVALLEHVHRSTPNLRYDERYNDAFGTRDGRDAGPFVRICKLIAAIHYNREDMFFPHSSPLADETYDTSPLFHLMTANSDRGKEKLKSFCNVKDNNTYYNSVKTIEGTHGLAAVALLRRLVQWYPIERRSGDSVPYPNLVPNASPIKHTLARLLDEEPYFNLTRLSWDALGAHGKRHLYVDNQSVMLATARWIDVSTDPLDSRVNPAEKRARNKRKHMFKMVEEPFDNLFLHRTDPIKQLALAMRDVYKITGSTVSPLSGRTVVTTESVVDEDSVLENDPMDDIVPPVVNPPAQPPADQ